MAKNKIERIDQEITKVREKIAEYQENFPSSFYIPQPPLLWLRELWKSLRRYLPS